MEDMPVSLYDALSHFQGKKCQQDDEVLEVGYQDSVLDVQNCALV